MKKRTLTVAVLPGLMMISSLVMAQSQETATATRGDMKLAVNIPGVFVADDKDEIKVEPLQYRGDLIVTRILAEGTAVQEGDLLIAFDTDNLDEAIETARNESIDAEVAFRKATAEYQSALIDQQSQQTQLARELGFLQLDVKAAVAQQAFDLTEKQKAIKDAEQRLADRRVDLETLKAVFAESGLSDSESRNIMVEREELKVENDVKAVEFERRKLEYFIQFEKSKTHLEKVLEVSRKQAEIEKQKIVTAAEVAQKNSNVIKTQRKLDAANEKVAELERDRDGLRILSPRNGTVFYGTTENEVPAGIIIGGMPDVRDQLRIGGRVSTHSVLLTVASMERLSVKMNLKENDIQHVENGLPITVHPDAFPGKQFEGRLTQVDQIAIKVGFVNSERRFKVMGKCTDEAPQLRSGMNCRVTIYPKAIRNAIQIPIVAVFEEDEKWWCYVDSGSAEKREVEIGLSNADSVQITKGLEEGELVYLESPVKD